MMSFRFRYHRLGAQTIKSICRPWRRAVYRFRAAEKRRKPMASRFARFVFRSADIFDGVIAFDAITLDAKTGTIDVCRAPNPALQDTKVRDRYTASRYKTTKEEIVKAFATLTKGITVA